MLSRQVPSVLPCPTPSSTYGRHSISVERRSPEGVFQCGFVVYKSVLAAASNIVILIQRVLP